MKRITEIFVILENKPSTLGDLCAHLADNKISILAIGLFQDTAKLYVKEIDKALKVLKKFKYETELRDVLKIDLEERPGALAEVSMKLGRSGINIEYCYGSLTKKGRSASVILDVSDIDKAESLLKGL
jgi:hypothetical protein